MPQTSRRLRLAPSLLSADFGALGEAVRAAEAGGADAFHLDVMDGVFVPNISFGPALVSAVRARTKLPIDIHLMVQEPARHLESFVKSGGNTLVIHYEAGGDPRELIDRIHALGVDAGLALRPDTPVEKALPLVGQLEQLMIMGVHPGFSGKKFIPDTVGKLREARDLLDEKRPNADLSIDGGVTLETARTAARLGATFFVCGNSVFGAGTVAENLTALRQAVGAGVRDAIP